MHRFIIGCFLLLLLSGCNFSSEPVVTKILNHRTIILPDMLIGYPGGIQKMGDNLIIMDYKSDSLFHWVDLKKNSYLGMFGPKGEGPNELIHPTSLQPYSENEMYCYDIMKQAVCAIRYDSIAEAMTCSAESRFENNWAFDMLPCSKDRFVANGCFRDSLFGLFDRKGELVQSVGDFPCKDENEKKLSPENRAMAYQGTLRVTGQGKVAFAPLMAKMILLYRMVDGKLVEQEKVIDSYVNYVPDKSAAEGAASVVFDGNYPMCYKDLSVSDNYVYALYSGRSFKEFHLKQIESSYIYVYNWEGEFVSLYKLDVPVICFCVDEVKEEIYAIANLPDPTLVVFSLK